MTRIEEPTTPPHKPYQTRELIVSPRRGSQALRKLWKHNILARTTSRLHGTRPFLLASPYHIIESSSVDTAVDALLNVNCLETEDDGNKGLDRLSLSKWKEAGGRKKEWRCIESCKREDDMVKATKHRRRQQYLLVQSHFAGKMIPACMASKLRSNSVRYGDPEGAVVQKRRLYSRLAQPFEGSEHEGNEQK